MKIARVAVLALIVSGCAFQSPEQRRAGWEKSCAGYGFQPKTVEYAKCLQKESIEWRTRKARAGAAIMGGSLSKPAPAYNAPVIQMK